METASIMRGTSSAALRREFLVDLMGRLSNPPETLECVADQGGYDAPPPKRARSKGPKRPFALGGSAIPEEKGRLSNPVQRRLSADEIDELARLYLHGATIDALGRRYGVHPTTVIGQLDRRGIPRRRAARKMSDTLVIRAAKQYSEGRSVADVASEFGVHARTLAREFRRAGIVTRPRRGWGP